MSGLDKMKAQIIAEAQENAKEILAQAHAQAHAGATHMPLLDGTHAQPPPPNAWVGRIKGALDDIERITMALPSICQNL